MLIKVKTKEKNIINVKISLCHNLNSEEEYYYYTVLFGLILKILNI